MRIQRLRHLTRPAFSATAVIFLLVGPAFSQSTTRTAPRNTPNRSRTFAQTPPKMAAKGIAVVELFTSQGCSSCPRADAVLRQIDSVAKSGNHPVFVLSFHVDYWNRLGWTDPYSSPEYSQRQRSYASATGSLRIYTPQMIVNGTNEFVGSKTDKANAAILDSLKTNAAITVKLTDAKTASNAAASDRTATVAFKLSGRAIGQIINIAIVADPPANKVPRGENFGRNLTHVNVVRSFKSTKITDASGAVQLKLPDDFDAANATVIAYVQNPRGLKITGASSRPLQSS